jgi:hypothetical protein
VIHPVEIALFTDDVAAVRVFSERLLGHGPESECQAAPSSPQAT